MAEEARQARNSAAQAKADLQTCMDECDRIEQELWAKIQAMEKANAQELEETTLRFEQDERELEVQMAQEIEDLKKQVWFGRTLCSLLAHFWLTFGSRLAHVWLTFGYVFAQIAEEEARAKKEYEMKFKEIIEQLKREGKIEVERLQVSHPHLILILTSSSPDPHLTLT